MRIRLVVLDSDKNYLSRLSVVFTNKYADKIEFYSFTDEKMAMGSLSTGRIDVFLANELFAIDVDAIPERCCFAYIVENAEIESIRSQRAIAKYQRADLFYKQILSLYAEKAMTVTGYKISDASQARVVSFVSFGGGDGSSTTAAAFAIYAAKSGKKVLYLNMEQFGSSEDFFSGEGQFDFSDVIYTVKSKKSNITLKLESAVKQDASGVHFYSSPKVALDLMELNDAELQGLLNELCISGNYDYIVVDMDFSFGKKVINTLGTSSKVVFVNDGTEVSNTKFERGYQALKLYEQQNNVTILARAYLFYNKFSNKVCKTIEGLEIRELGGVPKFENATTKQIVEQLVALTDFSKLMED